ncbi:SDR family oxidoreductase [Nocardia sp. NPDC088792]|uniref:SDR family oxidoreductase n=1 Tax=Nocardia sp. NPDC088792 TaxID=3364332 RepID=UPI0037FE2331
MSYLVIGGTGRTGRQVVDQLRAQGHAVVIGTRRPRGDDAVAVDLAQPLPVGVLDDIAGVVVSVEPPVDAAGADAVMNRGIARLAGLAGARQIQLVLLSQIYITRAEQHPELAGIIRARAAGEQAVRDSGAPYTIVRPAWLTDAPATGHRLEQGDRGDGKVSRETVARAAVAALLHPAARGKTFELYDDANAQDWATGFAELLLDR